MDIYKEWSGYGFDSVEVINYTVLLSYPDKDKPNSLGLKDSSGAVIYDSKIAEEPPLTDDEKKPNVAAPFNAYSGSGTVTVCYIHVLGSSFFREENLVLRRSLRIQHLAQSIGIQRNYKATYWRFFGGVYTINYRYSLTLPKAGVDSPTRPLF